MLSTDNNDADSTRDSDLESLVKYTRLSDDGAMSTEEELKDMTFRVYICICAVMTIVPLLIFAIIYLVNSLKS